MKPILPRLQTSVSHSNLNKTLNLSSSRSMNRLKVQPSRQYIYDVIQAESYVKSTSGNNTLFNSSINFTLDRSQSQDKQIGQNDLNISRQNNNLENSNQKRLQNLNQVIQSQHQRINPQLLQPVLLSNSKDSRGRQNFKGLNSSRDFNASQQFTSSQTNIHQVQIDKPIKSLRVPPKANKTQRNISILTNSIVTEDNQKQESASGAIELSKHSASQVREQQNERSVEKCQDNINVIQEYEYNSQNIENLSPVRAQQMSNQKHFLADSNINGCRSCTKTTPKIGYAIIDLQQSHEKSKDHRHGTMSEVNFCKNGERSADNFQSIEFRSMDNIMNSQQKKKQKRRELAMSQTSEFIQNLVSRVKSVMSQSAIKKKKQQIQQLKESQNNRQREMLKTQSKSRLEQIKGQMTKSLVKARQSKERVLKPQEQQQLNFGLVSSRDQHQRQVSQFGKQILQYSERIEQLMINEKNTKQPFREQNLNKFTNKQQSIMINAKFEKRQRNTGQKLQNQNVVNKENVQEVKGLSLKNPQSLMRLNMIKPSKNINHVKQAAIRRLDQTFNISKAVQNSKNTAQEYQIDTRSQTSSENSEETYQYLNVVGQI